MASALKLFAIVLAILFISTSYVVMTTPDPRPIKDCLTTKLYKVSLCPGSENYVRLKSINKVLVNMILASEDASFYSHSGFDWDELKNSFKTNLTSRKYVRGGSTITQQLAKNVFLTNEKSLLRKLREAILARQIEAILTKEQILERYLNVIEFGQKIYGIKKASRHYFDKSPEELNLLESAYLAYLLPNPKVHSLSFKSEKLTPYGRYRVLSLCYRLLRFRKISSAEYEFAKNSVDLFPWRGLVLEMPATGIDTAAPETDSQIHSDSSLNESLPESDETLNAVEPEPEIEILNESSDVEPPAETLGAPQSAELLRDQPFEQ